MLQADSDQNVIGSKRTKGVYIGAPACFSLEMACSHIRAAFVSDDDPGGIYVVGSCLERQDWGDIDVRLIMSDEAFERLFPSASLLNAAWEHDPRWVLMVTTIAQWMSSQTGLPIDFQFQPATFANERHLKARQPVGFRYVR